MCLKLEKYGDLYHFKIPLLIDGILFLSMDIYFTYSIRVT